MSDSDSDCLITLNIRRKNRQLSNGSTAVPATGPNSSRNMNLRLSSSTDSVRSIGSNGTLTATDIALALKNKKFTDYDMSLIEEACNKTIKGRLLKEIEKRRNNRRKLKLFSKDARRNSHDDSGYVASDSSLSSDDCKSTRTGMTVQHDFTRNISAYSTHLPKRQLSAGALSCRTVMSKIREESRMNGDASFKNLFRMKPKNFNSSRLNGIPLQKSNETIQNDKFHNSFLLQSERFKHISIISRWNQQPARNIIPEQDREVQDASAEVTMPALQDQRKRSHERSDLDIPNINIKKIKLEDKRTNDNEKTQEKHTQPTNLANLYKNSDSHCIARPQIPLRKSNELKPQEKILVKTEIKAEEKILAKTEIKAEVKPEAINKNIVSKVCTQVKNNFVKENVSIKTASELANRFWTLFSDDDSEGIYTPINSIRLNFEQNEKINYSTKRDTKGKKTNATLKSASKRKATKAQNHNNKESEGEKSCVAYPPTNCCIKREESIQNNGSVL